MAMDLDAVAADFSLSSGEFLILSLEQISLYKEEATGHMALPPFLYGKEILLIIQNAP